MAKLLVELAEIYWATSYRQVSIGPFSRKRSSQLLPCRAGRFGVWISALAAFAGGLSGQSTQGTIGGVVRDSLTDLPIAGAAVQCANLDSGIECSASADKNGNFTVLMLSPGQYRLRVTADGYQAREMYGIELAVGGRLSILFRLRSAADLWEARQQRTIIDPGSNKVYNFYGPDIDPNRIAILHVDSPEASNPDSSVSDVISARMIRDLPLEGRDVYSLLGVLPAVTADTATGRGINVSVAGQRPSTSNFLLDGVENDNYLVTGPLAAVNPDGIQEYRISTNNYSAEYGRTGSFVANAVSRAGTNQWHGAAWMFFGHDVWNANGFQENWQGIRRAPVRQTIPGAIAGGPVWKERLFTSASFEHQRFRSAGDPQPFLLPTQRYAIGLAQGTPAATLLRPFTSILPADPSADAAQVLVNPPKALDQTSALERTDYASKNGKQRITGRLGIYSLSEPGLVYNPYPGYSSGIAQRASALTAAWTVSVKPGLTNEARASKTGERYGFDRPHAEVPALETYDHVTLPGSIMFTGLDERDATWELLDNLTLVSGRHQLKAGGGWLGRRIRSFIGEGAAGLYTIAGLQDFAKGIPQDLTLTYDRRISDPSMAPDYGRAYGYSQTYWFVQDSYQPAKRLAINLGLRYERFDNPANTGQTKDSLIQLGAGNTFWDKLATAGYTVAGAGRQTLYTGPQGNWAGRFGFSYAPGRGSFAIRGSYGLFYDRPFDNDWQSVGTNSLMLGTSFFNPGQVVNFLLPPRSVAAANPLGLAPPVEPILFQQGLRSAIVQQAFLSAEQRISRLISWRVMGISTLGRRLVTTDIVNRDYSQPADTTLGADGRQKNPLGRINPHLGELLYRGNQGKSDYVGGSAVLGFHGRQIQGQASYTWSHAIDNQSDPLVGSFGNYSLGQVQGGNVLPTVAAFTTQFDSQGDRANADFDQRHTLVVFGMMESPEPANGKLKKLAARWRFGTIAALRSGFFYSALANPSETYNLPVYVNNRADQILASADALTNSASQGVKQLLNQAAFHAPAAGKVGNTGRNAFEGPGLFNVDLSVARTFHVPKMGETRQVTVRANAFNLLNHANLNGPYTSTNFSYCCRGYFGTGSYGRSEASNGSPLLLPLAESARQVQMMVKFEF